MRCAVSAEWSAGRELDELSMGVFTGFESVHSSQQFAMRGFSWNKRINCMHFTRICPLVLYNEAETKHQPKLSKQVKKQLQVHQELKRIELKEKIEVTQERQ